MAILTDNSGETGYIQRKDVEDARNDEIGERIFSLFLSYGNSRLDLIIRIKQCTEKNSTYQQASHIEEQFKGRRIIRQLGNLKSKQAFVAGLGPLCRKCNRK